MFKRFTIRQRILTTFLAIVLAGGLLQLLIAGRQLQQSTLQFYQHDLETNALTIASTLSESMEHYLEGEGTGTMQRILANLQPDDGHHYLILDRSYQVIGYTANTGYEAVDRAPKTPELTTAAKGEIGSDIRKGYDDTDRLYVAVSIRYESETIGYLVLSRSMDSTYAAVYQQWLELGSTSLPIIALVIVASLWLSGTISRPVQQLTHSALKMAKGELDTRIKIDTQDEIGQLAHSFNYMAEHIEVLMKTQRSFVSNAAHELRTPLMTLKLRAEALEDEHLPVSQRSTYMQEIQQEVNHMAELVSSLLVLARIDEGRNQYEEGITDTKVFLQDVSRHWRIAATQAGLAYHAQIPDDLPALNLAANALRLVLDNLLGNAIKYTEKGDIHLTVGQNAGQMTIEIRDTGIGFDPAKTADLFIRFYRTDEARTHFEGTGLGLSIVQSILAQHGGHVTASSEGIGQGATFTVQLTTTTSST